MIAALISFMSIAMPNAYPNAIRLTPNAAMFIHGAGGGGWEWKAWVPVFEKAGWTCIAKDLMATRTGIEATRFSDYLAQVEAQALANGKGKLVLIGASMGGILAL